MKWYSYSQEVLGRISTFAATLKSVNSADFHLLTICCFTCKTAFLKFCQIFSYI